jgi:hypothetical protein
MSPRRIKAIRVLTTSHQNIFIIGNIKMTSSRALIVRSGTALQKISLQSRRRALEGDDEGSSSFVENHETVNQNVKERSHCDVFFCYYCASLGCVDCYSV